MEVSMGDKSPKSKQRNKKQKEAAKARSDKAKQTPQQASAGASGQK